MKRESIRGVRVGAARQGAGGLFCSPPPDSLVQPLHNYFRPIRVPDTEAAETIKEGAALTAFTRK